MKPRSWIRHSGSSGYMRVMVFADRVDVEHIRTGGSGVLSGAEAIAHRYSIKHKGRAKAD